ncbi:Protein ura1, partial [Diplonema papillatum]
MDYIVIEVNARLSRSSALASKATGYPLAAVAAKLALGIELPDVINSVTKGTTACFEPSLDYVVVKMPRWDLSKFNMVSHKIGSVMKSVGEVMAIGRSFQEAFQKAIRMADTSYTGFDEDLCPHVGLEAIKEDIVNPTPKRIFSICKAFKMGCTVAEVHAWSKIDAWFLEKLKDIVNLATFVEAEHKNNLNSMTRSTLWELKALGFSDEQIASRIQSTHQAVRARRKACGVVPFVKQIDTVAGEFPADTNANYLYLTYNASFDDITPASSPIAVLGSGVYRIGSSVEFDFCGVMALRNLRDLGYETVMINSNPETVSTDYDESGRLYFEELSLERVMDICEKENPAGVVISVGGQLSQNLALPLEAMGVKVLGTSPKDIDNAEDRSKFSALCDTHNVDQPAWSSLTSFAEATEFCKKVGYPVLIRPSYVLSGSAMNVVWREEDLVNLLKQAAAVSKEYPVVISKYHDNSIELDVDVVANDGELLTWAISQHLENAGVHSGDATMVLPPLLPKEDLFRLKAATVALAKALNVKGPMNVQYLKLPDGSLKVIEANVRCSRSVPFVSKSTGVDFSYKMTQVLTSTLLPAADRPAIAAVDMRDLVLPHISIKAPMFSYVRLAGADPILGVEMSSTGEVGCFGHDFDEVFLKAMLCSGFKMPKKTVFLTVETASLRDAFFESARTMAAKYELYATPDTARHLSEHGVACGVLHPPKSSATPNYSEAIKKGLLHMVVSLRDETLDWELKTADQSAVTNGYLIRRSAIDFAVPLFTNLQIARHIAR